MVNIPFLIFPFSYLRPSLLPQNYSCTYQRVNCQCNVFWQCVAIIIAGFFTKYCSYRNKLWYPIVWWWFRTVSWKKNNRCSYVFLPIFMFWHSRFSFRNLKDANLCMFSWHITTSSLLICSCLAWYDSFKCTVFTVSLCYLQVLTIYKKVLS